MTGNGKDRAETVLVPAGGVYVPGDLVITDEARGMVLFAHGSGSSRFSPRNRFVARQLRGAGLATFLVDLLTPDEGLIDEQSRALRFDIGLLAGRLQLVSDWLVANPRTAALRLGYFGASTGAGAALVAAAARPARVEAVVSRGGRPDLAGPSLAAVRAPTLLIVGGQDEQVLRLNERAMEALSCEKKLAIVPGATHLFEERGALEQVAELAALWFLGHVSPQERAPDCAAASSAE
jgi:dienelactone hydrolase